MKINKNFNYTILTFIFLIGLIIGYSPNFSKIKRFHRTHAAIGIDLDLQLTYLENAIHYVLSITDFNQKKIEKYQFTYTNRIPIAIVRNSLPVQHTVTLLLKDRSGIAVLYKKDISVKSFLSHYCGCSINFRGKIEEKDVPELKNLWKNTNEFQIPSSFLYDRSKMFTGKISF